MEWFILQNRKLLLASEKLFSLIKLSFVILGFAIRVHFFLIVSKALKNIYLIYFSIMSNIEREDCVFEHDWIGHFCIWNKFPRLPENAEVLFVVTETDRFERKWLIQSWIGTILVHLHFSRKFHRYFTGKGFMVK